VLSWLGSKLTDHLALRALVASCVTFHAATAVLEIYAFMQGTSIAIWANVAARVAIIGLLLYYRPLADR
jgi:hypothetical protein